MARDRGLEEVLDGELAGLPGLSTKPMFGGLAYLLNGNLLCGARHDGLLVRVGKDNEASALAIPGVAPMHMQARPMPGWVRADPDVCADDALRGRLLEAALEFTRSLPEK